MLRWGIVVAFILLGLNGLMHTWQQLREQDLLARVENLERAMLGLGYATQVDLHRATETLQKLFEPPERTKWEVQGKWLRRKQP